MSKKVVKKKKSKLIKTRLFTVLFAVMFIVSLFTGIKAFAETGPFKLNSATISDKATGVTGSISSFNDSEVINDITFHKIDDYATFKFELKSNLNREITILEITDDNSNSYIVYEYDKHENEKLASNGTLNFIVKAVYKNELTDTSKRNQTNNVKFTIKYLDNGEEKSDEIIVNPKTGDGISKSIVMLIISSVGLVTCITLDKKRKSKKLSKLSVLILTGLVLSPIVVKAATFAYELTLKSTIGLYDKIVVTIDDKVNPVTTQTIEYNTKLDSLPSPTKTGYTLTNWTVNNEEFDITKEIKEDITIEANYRKNNYTITFAPNVPVGGELDPATSMNDIVLDYDEERNLPPIGYLVTGYNFDSWNTMPDGSGTKYEDMDSVIELTSTDGEIITLYARWGATPYTVIFDKNHANATGTMENISKAYNETFNLPKNKYKRTGYNFNGWNTSPMADGTHYDDEQSVKNLDIDGEITLYAEWAPTIITITYNKNSDEATGTMSGQIVVYDVQNKLNDNSFSRTGYNFNGWNTQADGQGTHYDNKADITNTFLEDTTLYAEWNIKKYIVKFDKNSDEATGTMVNQKIPIGQTTALNQNSYAREHYRFDGWNTEPDGSGTHYDNGEEVLNIIDTESTITLYAEWTSLINTLQTGLNINNKLNNNATSFAHYTGTPNLDIITNKVNIATDDSDLPVYLWNDNGTIYWWTEAEKTYMNEDSSQMFFNKTNLTSIDITGLDTSKVTNMWRMFRDTSSLDTLVLGDFNTSNVENMQAMFQGCGLSQLDVSTWDTKKVETMWAMFSGMPNITELDLSTFNIQSLTTMQEMFRDSTTLIKINLSGWDLSNVNIYENWISNTGEVAIDLSNGVGPTDMSNFFVNSKAKSIDLSNFNTQATTNMSNLFSGNTKLTSLDLTNLNTSNVTNMSGMFSGCSKIESLDLSGFNTQGLTNIESMFAGTSQLTTLNLSGWNLSNVNIYDNWISNTGEVAIDLSNGVGPSDMSYFFASSNIKSIDLSNFNAQATTDMSFLFNHSTKLTSVDLTNINTSSVTTMNSMFNECSSLAMLDVSDLDTGNVQDMYRMFRSTSLQKLDLSSFDTRNVANMSGMFGHVLPLTTLDISGFDTKKVTTMNSMFYNLPNLKTIYASGGFETNSLNDSHGVFYSTPVLKGGSGTTWNNSMSDDVSYARIDDPDNGKPGLFTDIADKPIEP